MVRTSEITVVGCVWRWEGWGLRGGVASAFRMPEVDTLWHTQIYYVRARAHTRKLSHPRHERLCGTWCSSTIISINAPTGDSANFAHPSTRTRTHTHTHSRCFCFDVFVYLHHPPPHSPAAVLHERQSRLPEEWPTHKRCIFQYKVSKRFNDPKLSSPPPPPPWPVNFDTQRTQGAVWMHA